MGACAMAAAVAVAGEGEDTLDDDGTPAAQHHTVSPRTDRRTLDGSRLTTTMALTLVVLAAVRRVHGERRSGTAVADAEGG